MKVLKLRAFIGFLGSWSCNLVLRNVVSKGLYRGSTIRVLQVIPGFVVSIRFLEGFQKAVVPQVVGGL